MHRWISAYAKFLIVLSFHALAGCDSSSPDDGLVEGVDIDALFAPATNAEIATVQADWGGRDVSVQGLVEEAVDTLNIGGGKQTVARVVSHTVGGVRHVGVIAVPIRDTPAPLPLLVYAHAGDEGENLDATLTLISLGFNAVIDQFIFVVPSYRSEFITLNGVTYTSEGAASPWDRDVDDALALLNVAIATTPEADSTRIGVMGFSRGGGVGLLMAARDPRIDRVVEFFGPTDFFAENVRENTVDLLSGRAVNLPGADVLDDLYLQPLKNGTLTIAETRLELVRRSAVLFADRLPALQLHHGDQDAIVPVLQAQSMIAAMEALSRGAPDFEAFIYPGAGHSPLELVGSFDRTVEFLSVLQAQPSLFKVQAPSL